MVKIQTLFNTTDVNIVRLLLFHGADVDERNKFGQTPLHVHASMCHHAILQTLMARGADPEARDNIGRTPMHAAVWSGDARATAMLARHSDLWRAMDDEGVTPTDLAVDREDADVIEALKDIMRERAIATMLSAYSRCGDYQCAKMIAQFAFPDLEIRA
jgi:ankyrin repeat protein